MGRNAIEAPWKAPLRIWSLTALLACAVLWLTIYLALQSSHNAWLNQGREKVATLASSYRNHVEDAIEQIDQVSWFMAFMHDKGISVETLQEVIEKLPVRTSFNPLYTDAHGNVLSARKASTVGLTVKDAAFFQRHMVSTSLELQVNPLENGIGRLAGRKVVRFSRRLNDAKGHFDGVISITLMPEDLLKFGGDNELAEGDTLGLRFLDGEWLVHRKVGSKNLVSEQIDKTVLITGDQIFSGTMDGHTLLISWSKLQFFPIQAYVGIDVVNALRVHDETEAAYRFNLFTGTVLIILACLIFGWLHWRRNERAMREQRVRNTFRIAVDGAREELYMVSFHSPRNRARRMYRIEDCNGQAVRMAGRERDELIGRSLDDVLMTQGREDVKDFLREAIEHEFAESEIWLKRGHKRRWYHCRAVRADLGLAVTLRDITDLKDKEQQLKDLALTDALTRLPNRRWMQQFLPQMIAESSEQKTRFAVLFIDLDNFKVVNDTLGHQAGDEFLRDVAIRLRKSVRKQDQVLRLGGDEFMILLRDIDEPKSALDISSYLLQTLRAIDPLQGNAGIRPRASIGLAFFPDDAQDAETLVQAADIAMYESKRSGKDRVTRYTSDMHRDLADRVALEGALQSAVVGEQLMLYLQPRAFAGSGTLAGFEALLRWQHPQLGLVAPHRFIPLAEESSLIVEIGNWVAERACMIIADWRERGLPVYPISINVSPKQLLGSDFRQHLQHCIERYGVQPTQLALELTESTMIGDDRSVQKELEQLEALGLRLMIDDFGTGYSSLALLHRLNVDVLKIDQSFVQNLGPDSESFVLCQAMIQLAQSLGIATVAEGVETVQQLRLLRLLGCDEIQGYLAAPPVPAKMAESWLDGVQFFESAVLGPTLKQQADAG
jgi:diguanylate cyclase (GGDEF)-like protein/PAS domain S-box-containing protein